MSEFTFLFRGRATFDSPEQMRKNMEKWVAWFRELGAQGHIKNPGHPLAPIGQTVTGKQKIITDGPYVEAKDLVGGYMLVEAKDLAHAVEISKGCPILEAGGAVEVRPIEQLTL